MTTTITFGNFKGGTGKTTNGCMISYILSLKGFKTLLVDMDPQGNATSLLLKTKQRLNKSEIVAFEKTLMSAINDDSLEPIITSIKENLDLLPSYADFTSYPIFLEKKYPNSIYDRSLHFNKLLKDIKPNYDYIIIDVPPTVSVYTDNALMASDYTVIVLQTQERSLDGAKSYIIYLQELVKNYKANFNILGILPVLLKNTSPVDQSILKLAHKDFGETNMFKTLILNMERLKRYDVIGIVDPTNKNEYDMHDRRVFKLYDQVTNELIKRVGEK